MSSTKIYKALLDNFMAFHHGIVYKKEQMYTPSQLLSITPNDVLRWMNFRCFGTPDPPSDTNPTLARSNTFKFWKQASSLFMPNCLIEWSRTQEEGNPTRSIEINDLIKRVKKKEVRQQGAASKTRRPMKEAKFRLLIEVLKGNNNSYLWKFGIPA
jgi:hypothetical protein